MSTNYKIITCKYEYKVNDVVSATQITGTLETQKIDYILKIYNDDKLINSEIKTFCRKLSLWEKMKKILWHKL